MILSSICHPSVIHLSSTCHPSVIHRSLKSTIFFLVKEATSSRLWSWVGTLAPKMVRCHVDAMGFEWVVSRCTQSWWTQLRHAGRNFLNIRRITDTYLCRRIQNGSKWKKTIKHKRWIINDYSWSSDVSWHLVWKMVGEITREFLPPWQVGPGRPTESTPAAAMSRVSTSDSMEVDAGAQWDRGDS